MKVKLTFGESLPLDANLHSWDNGIRLGEKNMNTQENGLSGGPCPGETAEDSAHLRPSRPLGRYGTDAQIASSEDKIRDLHTIYLQERVTDAGFQLMAKLQLPYLRELHIIDTAISDQGIIAIEEMTELRWLNIDRAKIGNSSLVCIRNLENLVGLHLTSTRINDAGLWKLGRLKQLEYLNLQQNEISDLGMPDLAKLENLKTLCLDYTLVSDSGLLKLIGMKNLRTLSLLHTKVTAIGAAWLQVLLPECLIRLAGHPITFGGLPMGEPIRISLVLPSRLDDQQQCGK